MESSSLDIAPKEHDEVAESQKASEVEEKDVEMDFIDSKVR